MSCFPPSPLSQYGEVVSEHESREVRNPCWPDDWNVKYRAQRVYAEVPGSVDTYGVKSFFLGVHRGFEDCDVQDQVVEIAVERFRSNLSHPVDELDVRPKADQLSLCSANFHSVVIEWDWHHHKDSLHAPLPKGIGASQSHQVREWSGLVL